MIAETYELLKSIHEKIKVKCHVSAILRAEGLEIEIVAKIDGVFKDYHRLFQHHDFINPLLHEDHEINYMCENFNRILRGVELVKDMMGNGIIIGDTVSCDGLLFEITSFEKSPSGDMVCGEYGCFSTGIIKKVKEK